jgi:hypothetical protein
MAETPADVRRDIEVTRQRMSGTIDELEQKLNVKQLVADHPWPALALAVGAGVLLASSRTDMKAAAAAASASQGAGSKLGAALDTVMANLMSGQHGGAGPRGWMGRRDRVRARRCGCAGRRGRRGRRGRVAAEAG